MNKYKKVPVCIGFLLPVFLIYTIFLFVPLVQSAYYSLKLERSNGKGFCGFR